MTFYICLHIYFTDFFEPLIFLREGQENKQWGFTKRQFRRFKCHAVTYTTCLMSDLSVCVSASVAQQPPCLFIWQFYMCIAQSSRVKVSNTSIHIAKCFTILVYICMCLCLCRTECPLSVLSGLPDRLLLGVLLFLPSVEVKKTTSPDLAWGPLFDSGAQILFFRYVCIFLCGNPQVTSAR